MDEALIKEIAEGIAQGHTVRPLAGVVDGLAQAYGIQEKLRPHLGPICGRKIAMNAPALMAAAGISEPIVGYITGTRPMASGGEVSLSDFADFSVEPEFAAVIGKDVPAGAKITAQNVSEYVARFSLALEILDKRHDAPPMHAPTFVANNVYNAGVVLADDVLDADMIAGGEYDAQFTAAGDTVLDGSNTAPQNPLEACAYVLNHFTQRGDIVTAGEVILCGAHYPPKPYERAGEYRFSLSSGAFVSLSISL